MSERPRAGAAAGAAEGRRARVRCVVAATARIADPGDVLGREARSRLPAASGLSPEGVELALATALERRVTEPQLDRLLAWAGDAEVAWVVASANVCTAAARSIALAAATSCDVRVCPSRRDPVVAELVIAALAEDVAYAAAGGRAQLVPALAARAGDQVHAYGSDATMDAIEAALDPGVTLRRHGTGLGVALVAGSDPIEGAADAIACDVSAFDQRGCLSPRVVVVEGDRGRTTALARALDAALSRWGRLVPRGPLDAALAGELARWIATQEALGEVVTRPSHAVAVHDAPTSLAIAPAVRAVLVVAAEDIARVAVLAPLARWIAAFGRDDPGAEAARAIHALAPGARASRLGSMQRPPLDGPVERRESSSVRGAPRADAGGRC